MAAANEFRNFNAASKKRNMIDFGLAKLGTDLSWIIDNQAGQFGIQLTRPDETVTGTIDGNNRDFVIPVSNPWAVRVTLNGLVVEEGVGYVFVPPNIIRFDTSRIPKPAGVGGRTVDDVIRSWIWE